MKLVNCVDCGKLFVKTINPLCPSCFEQEEENEKIIAEYVRDNPGSSITKVHEATGIKEKTIYRMIKNGRFVGTACAIPYPCESCGTEIYEGRFCAACSKNLAEQAQKMDLSQKSVEPKADVRRSGGMYTKHM